MKRFLSLVALMLACPIAPAVWAEEPANCVVQIVRVPANHREQAGAHIYDLQDWNRHVQDGDFQVLEKGSLQASLGHPGLLTAGTKLPIIYADPRTGAYQVQYVDLGLKVDLSASAAAGGKVLLDCNIARMEMTEAVPHPISDGLRTQTRVILHSGQVATLCSTRGLLTARHMEKNYPSVKFAEGDSVMITVGLEKP